VKPRRQTGIGGQEPAHLGGVSGNDHHQLVAEVLHVLQQGVDGVLAERVALVFGHQAISLVDEQHPAQGLLAHLFHALRGLRDVADDEVFLGDFDDVGPLNLAQPEQNSATMRAKLVLAVPAGLAAPCWSRWQGPTRRCGWRWSRGR
jgi:hypothetical protein